MIEMHQNSLMCTDKVQKFHLNLMDMVLGQAKETGEIDRDQVNMDIIFLNHSL